MQDQYGRKLNYLRISLTDRCNLQCRYCMPEEGICTIKQQDYLTFDEILRLVRIMAGQGIRKLRLTGGEPFVRKGVPRLVQQLCAVEGIEEVDITTNGVASRDIDWKQLVEYGLHGVNISLDALDPIIYQQITGVDGLEQVMQTIQDALAVGLRVKINCVPVCGINEQEIISVAQLARNYPVDVRFIELMPIGTGAHWKGVDSRQVMDRLESVFGPLEPADGSAEVMGSTDCPEKVMGAANCSEEAVGPAICYRPEGFVGRVGSISPMTHPFCASCNRLRLTADGKLKTCLYYDEVLDLRELLRNGATDAVIEKRIVEAVYDKPDRHRFQEANKEMSEPTGDGSEQKYARNHKKMVQIGG